MKAPVRFNWVLFFVAFFSVVGMFTYNKKYHYTNRNLQTLQTKYDSLHYEFSVQTELLNRYEVAISTLEKEDSTITMRWDLLENGIISKENRPLVNRGWEDDDDLELVGVGVTR